MDKRVYLAAIACLLVFSCYFYYSNMKLKVQLVDVMLTTEIQEAPERAAEPAEAEQVMFYIFGEVSRPDVYTLPKGSRIIDAIEKAGGKTENACFDMMESVAGEIKDGQKIYVPNVDDDIDKINNMNNNSNNDNGSGSARKDPNAVVNINAADIEELCQIPGIGEVTAKLIYDYRTENGNFNVIEDIKNVSRIGDKVFESIKKNITVD